MEEWPHDSVVILTVEVPSGMDPDDIVRAIQAAIPDAEETPSLYPDGTTRYLYLTAKAACAGTLLA